MNYNKNISVSNVTFRREQSRPPYGLCEMLPYITAGMFSAECCFFGGSRAARPTVCANYRRGFHQGLIGKNCPYSDAFRPASGRAVVYCRRNIITISTKISHYDIQWDKVIIMKVFWKGYGEDFLSKSLPHIILYYISLCAFPRG